MIRIAKKCIQSLYRPGHNYQKAGVMLVDLVAEQTMQHDMLIRLSPKKMYLMEVIDKINKKQGKNALFYGAEGIQREWRQRCGKRSARYTTRWDELLQAQLC